MGLFNKQEHNQWYEKKNRRFTYPDLDENESIYVYYVDILSNGFIADITVKQ